MTRLNREVRIDAPKERVWQILADFGGVSVYNPTVPNSFSTSDSNGGEGATRHCDLAPFGSVDERILEWREGEGYTLEIYSSEKTPPFKRAIASLDLSQDGEGTIVNGTLEYSLKYGPLGAVMDSMMVRAKFETAWSRLFAGLKHYAETGEPVSGKTDLNLAAVLAAA
jgi:carbon monoxide dehydrogenase subunit G